MCLRPLPVLSTLKTLMPFCPGVILSNVSREKCIRNVEKLPSINIRGGPVYHTDTVLVPICVDNNETCLLYTRRIDVMHTSGTKITFPGGGKIRRFESVYDAVARYTQLDIGICDIQFWTTMGQVLSRGANAAVTPVIGELMNFDIKKVKKDPNKITHVFTIPIRILCDSENHAHYSYDGVLMPVYTAGKYHIWGITAMITHRFLYTLLSKNIYNPEFDKRELNFRLIKS